MNTKTLALHSVAIACLTALAAPVMAQTASSSAYDGSANLSVPGGSFSLPAINPVGGSAPPAYSTANTVVSFSNSQTLGAIGLPADTLTVTADTLNSSASGTPSMATASASIHNLDFVFATAGVPIPLFELTATTIASTSTAGGGATTGSTTIEGVTLSGSLVGAPVTLTIPSTLPANDVVFDAAGVELVLNEQNALPGGIETNAVDLILNGATFGGSLPVSGNVILSHSQAQVGAVPEPATWTLMLLSMAGLGALARRRRATAAA